ncbi:Malonyl CoA-acyl carrier protein transacylase [hydrothermal vent metagenome]|uniref:[acyl-carrier-protein] S-malonyltransferase n=1 Tax=hydrothermal vent metagenome TaxID=652676 RepID=A0A3B0WUR3_9ZZZZ
MNIVVVFPGQGSQSVGMLADYAETWPQIEETFKQASNVLGYDCWDIVCNGPTEKINKTEITQPIMLAADIAVMRVMAQQCMLTPMVFAGHSLGEYAALVAAESINFEDAIKLVAKRGQLMQAAVPEGEGAMAAIIGLTDEPIIKICEQVSSDIGAPVEAVNFNSPGQVVIAGATAAVNKAMALLKEAGAKRALPLPVSVPSHSSLMKPAADELSEYLKTVNISTPKIQVIHNVDAKLHDDPDAIREALAKQLYNPVQWTHTVQIIADSADVVVECGPGKVLGGLTRRINKDVKSFSLDSIASMDKFLDAMSTVD